MPNTITSYTTFVADTKARAGQVNTNFSNHRGDLIPINTDTATASNLTHGLGTTEHRWTSSYIEDIYFGQTTTSWQFAPGTTTGDSFDFMKNGSTVGSISNSGTMTGFSYFFNSWTVSPNTHTVQLQPTATGSLTALPSYDISIAGALNKPLDLFFASRNFETAISTTGAKLKLENLTGGGAGLTLIWRFETITGAIFFSQQVGDFDTNDQGVPAGSIRDYKLSPGTTGSYTLKCYGTGGNSVWSFQNMALFIKED
jgi:hypothetical protein